jgi:hypothetical protein
MHVMRHDEGQRLGDSVHPPVLYSIASGHQTVRSSGKASNMLPLVRVLHCSSKSLTLAKESTSWVLCHVLVIWCCAGASVIAAYAADRKQPLHHRMKVFSL